MNKINFENLIEILERNTGIENINIHIKGNFGFTLNTYRKLGYQIGQDFYKNDILRIFDLAIPHDNENAGFGIFLLKKDIDTICIVDKCITISFVTTQVTLVGIS